MIDHLLGRPSERLKRLQVLLVLAFWAAVLRKGPSHGPQKLPWIQWISKKSTRFTPWQVFVFSLTGVYAVRHFDAIAGFGAPEPLARMYSRSFYRATWVLTALDAGFGTAMAIRPQWLRDLASVFFFVYYLIYAEEADEKLRRYRAFCTVEMLRATWEKGTNPYIRALTWIDRPSLGIARPLLLPRPSVGASAKRPTKAWLFYAHGESELHDEEELYLDFPGGGFICMTPQHHEERLRQLAKQVGRPVLAIEYCKAPEYPYPFAVEECFDVYRVLHETKGRIIGMSGSESFRVVLAGDSAGGNLAFGTLFKVIDYPQENIRNAYMRRARSSSGVGASPTPPPLPKPLAMVLGYPATNLTYTSWMKPEHIRVLRQQSEVNLANLASNGGASGKPLRGTEPRPRSRSRSRNRQQQRGEEARLLPSSRTSAENLSARRRSTLVSSRPLGASRSARSATASADVDPATRKSYVSLANQAQLHLAERARLVDAEPSTSDDGGAAAGAGEVWSDAASSRRGPQWLGRIEGDDLEAHHLHGTTAQHGDGSETGGSGVGVEAGTARMRQVEAQQQRLQEAAEAADLERLDKVRRAPVNTRLTMTSMAGYFQDRIMSQSMLRAMAILYIGPRRQPDFENDYFLSPIVAPARLLAEFPPCLFVCGEKDPICDDTVVMAGRIREAKLAKQADIRARRAGASARFGEELRMSSGATSAAAAQAALLRDPIEDESVEDWVQMRIIEGWSHGFLQMTSLLPEARHIISFMAAWAADVFDDVSDQLDAEAATEGVAALPAPTAGASQAGTTEAGEGAAPPSKRSRGAAHTLATMAIAAEDADAEEDEDEEPLSFVPKGRRSPSQNTETGASSPTGVRAAAAAAAAAPAAAGAAQHGAAGASAIGSSDAASSASTPPAPVGVRPGAPSEAARGEAAEDRADGGAVGPGSAAAAAAAAAPARLRRGSNMREASLQRRLSKEASGAVAGAAGLGAGAPTGAGGAGAGGVGGTERGDGRYRSLLVSESSLLQRRRDEAVAGLGESTSAVHDSDGGESSASDVDDGNHDEGRGSRDAAAYAQGERRGRTTRA